MSLRGIENRVVLQDHALDGSAAAAAAMAAAAAEGLAAAAASPSTSSMGSSSTLDNSTKTILYRPEDLAADITPAAGGIAQACSLPFICAAGGLRLEIFALQRSFLAR